MLVGHIHDLLEDLESQSDLHGQIVLELVQIQFFRVQPQELLPLLLFLNQVVEFALQFGLLTLQGHDTGQN